MVAVRRSRAGARRAFAPGLAAGAVYFAGTLYWLVQTMTTFGGLPVPVAILAAALLVAYLSLFPAAFAVILARLYRHLGAGALVMAPAVWVTTELGRQYVWDGFPWALLGYSQVTILPVAQIASVTGVYGVSALLAATATAAAFVIIDRSRARWAAAGLMAALVGAIWWWGAVRLAESRLLGTGEAVRVAVLQGNVAQEDKWNPAMAVAIVDRYIQMTREALGRGATFILWPESSTPFLFEHDLGQGATIRRLAAESGASLLVGSDQHETIAGVPPAPPVTRFYNAAFLVQPNGRIGAFYRKMHLVPFGEYVPLQKLLFFVGPIVETLQPFTPGTEATLLPIGTHRASTAICYEVIYPDLIRRFVQNGSELLTTITNDAWYGRSSAAYQHWEQASMRAIEEGRYLARAANTGISGFVDPYGRSIGKTELFVQATTVETIRFITERTIYSRFGDVIAWGSLALTVAALLATVRRP